MVTPARIRKTKTTLTNKTHFSKNETRGSRSGSHFICASDCIYLKNSVNSTFAGLAEELIDTAEDIVLRITQPYIQHNQNNQRSKRRKTD